MDRVVKTYRTNQIAQEKRQLLKDRGIESRIMVDPLAERYPDLAHFQGVAITVKDFRLAEAASILDVAPGMLPKAS